jgi:hypothetical protein
LVKGKRISPACSPEHKYVLIVSLFVDYLNIIDCGSSPCNCFYNPPGRKRNETFLCIFEKNIFLYILDDSKNILENRFFDQTSS